MSEEIGSFSQLDRILPDARGNTRLAWNSCGKNCKHSAVSYGAISLHRMKVLLLAALVKPEFFNKPCQHY